MSRSYFVIFRLIYLHSPADNNTFARPHLRNKLSTEFGFVIRQSRCREVCHLLSPSPSPLHTLNLVPLDTSRLVPPSLTSTIHNTCFSLSRSDHLFGSSVSSPSSFRSLLKTITMGDFDPYTQNVSFVAGDGKTPLSVPMSMIDAFHTESVSVCINYGAQLGACVIMLAVILVMTPSSKFRRPSSILHITGLTLCIIRMALLSAYFPSPFNDFYAYWAGDYSHVPVRDFVISIVANTFSLLLVIAIEAALMHQAWTMVKLWPNFWKYSLSALSAFITLFTIGWRLAFTVIQNKAVLSLIPPENMIWLIHLMVITNAASICWFCAIFNIKLIIHLISNRGVLPSYKTMTPMEVLITTNGMLMIIPSMFSPLVATNCRLLGHLLTLDSYLCWS